jgi:hypothetical protein
LLLEEKAAIVNNLMAGIKTTQEERDKLQSQNKDLHTQIEFVQKERDDAQFQARELQLQVLTHQNQAVFEFEINSLKQYPALTLDSLLRLRIQLRSDRKNTRSFSRV